MAGIVYYLGDSHLFHSKVVESRGFTSQEEHDNTIIDSIYQTCHRGDSLVLTGDICFGGAAGYIKAMRDGAARNMSHLGGVVPDNWRPNFTTKVTQGNHDSSKMLKELFDAGWLSKYGAHFEYSHCFDEETQDNVKILVSHIPHVLDRWDFNVHAHLHEKTLKDTVYLNSSWEQHRKPVTFIELLAAKNYLGGQSC